MTPELAWLAGLVAGIGWGALAGGVLGVLFVFQVASSTDEGEGPK